MSVMVGGGKVAVAPGCGGRFSVREMPLKFGNSNVHQLEEQRAV